MQHEISPKANGAGMSREELGALLRDVTEQRDRLLQQYESMAVQVDESSREVGDAMQGEQTATKRTRASLRLASEEAARADDLARQLEQQRRKNAALAADFASYRYKAEHALEENPGAMLMHSLSLVARDTVAWMRAKIPEGSALLPWFDRLVDITTRTGRFIVQTGYAFGDWARPRIAELTRRLRGEIHQRLQQK